MSRLPKGLFAEPDDPLKKLQQLHQELLETPGRALDDREIVARTLKLANDYADVLPADLISPHGFISLGHDKQMEAFFNKMPPTLLRETWDNIAKQREKFRQRLDMVSADRDAARAALNAEFSATLKQIIPVPRQTWTGSELATELLFATASAEARCNYVLMLLLDEKREIWKSLKRCGLHGCNRYFLSLSAGGGRPRLYCSGEHQETASRLTGAERTERWRERQKAKARKPK